MIPRIPHLALTALALFGAWALGTQTALAVHPYTQPEELKCQILEGLTQQQLQTTMHKLVFSSQSTVTTGITRIKIGEMVVLTGYACGW